MTTPAFYKNSNGQTCLVLELDDDVARLIAMDSKGLKITKIPMKDKLGFDPKTGAEIVVRTGFARDYAPISDYDVTKGAQIYLTHAKQCGAHKDAVEALASLVAVTDEDREIIRSKMQVVNIIKSPGPKAEKKEKTMKPASNGTRDSAASLFKELILAGTLSDDQIFAKVQQKYDLDEKKRSYVGWYRNWLRKDGQKPPEPKVTKKTAGKKEAKKPAATHKQKRAAKKAAKRKS